MAGRPRSMAPAVEALARRRLSRSPGTTLVMGVVNATPDSFHAGSRVPEAAEALRVARNMVAAGAAVIDVGGESTRPGARPIPPDEELARVLPIVEGLARDVDVPISIDTTKAVVARAAVAAGASIVNDVSGGRMDPAMARTVAEIGAAVIVGHLRGTPETMQDAPAFTDVVAEVRDELAERLDDFLGAGVPRELLLVDPGIGFGKRVGENLALLKHLADLASLGVPVVVGVSRKSFLSAVLARAGVAGATGPEDRLEASLAAAVIAAVNGAAIIRTHDVAATRRSLAIADAILHES